MDSTQLFQRLHPCVALFADLWRVSLPVARTLCLDISRRMADRLTYRSPPKMAFAVHSILKKPLGFNTLPRLQKYALPLAFFSDAELADWQACHPNHPPKQTLCLVGALLAWSCRYRLQFVLGKPTVMPYGRQILHHWQVDKVWLAVVAFVVGLCLLIYQHLSSQSVSQPKAPPSKIPDVAIVRVVDKDG